MKNFIGIFIFLLIINLSVPVLYYRIYSRFPEFDTDFNYNEPIDDIQESPKLSLMDRQTNSIIETSLEDYLIGAAACEMPALYEEEAIKAQMVAIHSYYIYCQNHPEQTENGYITINEKNMTGYASRSRLMEFWQTDYYDYYEKFRNCAQDVADEIAVYENSAALTPYHAVSCGKTADSRQVWGQPVPYLISVDSTHDQVSENYLQMKTIDKDRMFSLLSINFPNIVLDESTPQEWFGEIIYTESGYSSFVEIGSDKVPSDQVRKVLGLASTCLMIFYEDNNFSIATKGYGHGVGLSQFGANQLAKEGKDYKDILQYYYPGIEIKKL